jgi:hypothetical protein
MNEPDRAAVGRLFTANDRQALDRCLRALEQSGELLDEDSPVLPLVGFAMAQLRELPGDQSNPFDEIELDLLLGRPSQPENCPRCGEDVCCLPGCSAEPRRFRARTVSRLLLNLQRCRATLEGSDAPASAHDLVRALGPDRQAESFGGGQADWPRSSAP